MYTRLPDHLKIQVSDLSNITPLFQLFGLLENLDFLVGF